MASGNQNYYTNPAFCQQSEFYSQQCSPRGRNPGRALSPQRTRALSSDRVLNTSRASSAERTLSPERRQPPVGAYKPPAQEIYNQYHQRGGSIDVPPKIGPKPRLVQRSNSVQVRNQNINGNDEVFEEISVDERVAYHQKYMDASNGNVKYVEHDDRQRQILKKNPKGRYAVVPGDEEIEEPPVPRSSKTRYEYIPMQEQANGYPSSPRKILQQQQALQEEVEIVQGRIHRYAVIPADEEPQVSNKERYALVPVSEIKPNSRYAVVPSDESRNPGRYDYIPEDDNRRFYPETRKDYYVHSTPRKIPLTPQKENLIATQKLHELLSTPKKTTKTPPQKILSPQSQRRIASPQPLDPFCTPNKSPPSKCTPKLQTPKAQQKLNYTLSTRQPLTPSSYENKRHTAVIAPICSSPVQSVYSETTFSNKTESWMNMSLQKPPVQATLAVAAIMMVLCGGLTSALCFYMVSVVGRMYYLDFGTISGFACLLLGLLGFRSRNCHWLPNRNYISGYIVLSTFSLLTCAGLLVLLFLQPKPGSPLADVTSGAVCGISGLSLLLASSGVIASYCCKYPPPDNRVQHCAQGFIV